MNYYYIIKTIHVSKDDRWGATSDGIFSEPETPTLVIRKNMYDLCEGGYNQYATVIRFEEGVYPWGEELIWFRWNKEKDVYEECDRPEFLENWALSL